MTLEKLEAAAFEALISMDDFARMECGVDAIGAAAIRQLITE